jgi:hypothetical protein
MSSKSIIIRDYVIIESDTIEFSYYSSKTNVFVSFLSETYILIV